MVVLHGISRNAGSLARLFAPEAERTGRTLIVPHFPAKSWPDFQRPSKAARPDQALLALLDAVAASCPIAPGRWISSVIPAGRSSRIGSRCSTRTASRRCIWRRRAGTACRTRRCPIPTASRPGKDRLGTLWARRNAEGLPDFLGLPTCVYVGTEDVTRDPALRKTASLDAKQGPNRHARARSYVAALNAAASGTVSSRARGSSS